MHQKHAENLKSQLTDYNVDSFEDSSAICISTGQEIDFSVLQGLLQVSELGNEKYLNFVKERLVEGEKSIFEPISNVKTVTKRTNRCLVFLQQNQLIYMKHFHILSHHCH